MVSNGWFCAHGEERTDKTFTMQDLETVENEIEDKIGLTDGFIFVCDIKEGCVLITFGIISSVQVLPFSQRQIDCLLKIHIEVRRQYYPRTNSKRQLCIPKPISQLLKRRKIASSLEGGVINVSGDSNSTSHNPVLMAKEDIPRRVFVRPIPSGNKVGETKPTTCGSSATERIYPDTIASSPDGNCKYLSSTLTCRPELGSHVSLGITVRTFKHKGLHGKHTIQPCSRKDISKPVCTREMISVDLHDPSTISSTDSETTGKCLLKSVTPELVSKGASYDALLSTLNHPSTITKSCFSRAPKLTGASKTCSATLESSRTLPNFSASAVHASDSASGSALHNIRVIHVSAVVGTNSFEQIDGTLNNGLDTVTAVSFKLHAVYKVSYIRMFVCGIQNHVLHVYNSSPQT